jgi:hypothetical protein
MSGLKPWFGHEPFPARLIRPHWLLCAEFADEG